MTRLQSYAQGEWAAGTGSATDLIHAVTGEKIGEASSEGLDFKAMLEYARNTGNPNLRRLTFHERARTLKEMAKYLMERKDEFYKVSEATGATNGGRQPIDPKVMADYIRQLPVGSRVRLSRVKGDDIRGLRMEKGNAFVCGLSTRKILTPCEIQCSSTDLSSVQRPSLSEVSKLMG